MLRSRSSSIIFATMYLHCKNWRDADVAHCCIFFENLCDLFKKIGNFCITMSSLLAVALSLKIHIRHCIWMYPILQRPNMTNSDYLTLPKTSIRNQTNKPTWCHSPKNRQPWWWWCLMILCARCCCYSLLAQVFRHNEVKRRSMRLLLTFLPSWRPRSGFPTHIRPRSLGWHVIIIVVLFHRRRRRGRWLEASHGLADGRCR